MGMQSILVVASWQPRRCATVLAPAFRRILATPHQAKQGESRCATRISSGVREGIA
jgi:hypothetical protein